MRMVQEAEREQLGRIYDRMRELAESGVESLGQDGVWAEVGVALSPERPAVAWQWVGLLWYWYLYDQARPLSRRRYMLLPQLLEVLEEQRVRLNMR
jgi:hypothetical protein